MFHHILILITGYCHPCHAEPHIPPFHCSVQFSVVGGGVALAAAGALAAQSFLTSTTAAVVGGGAAAVGGVMMAQEQCLGESVNMMITVIFTLTVIMIMFQVPCTAEPPAASAVN